MRYTVKLEAFDTEGEWLGATRGHGNTPQEALADAMQPAWAAGDSADPPPAPRRGRRRGPTAGVSSSDGADTE